MNIRLRIFFVLIASLVLTVSIFPYAIAEEIPSWIKNNAKWWADGLISESDFVSGLEFLIQEDILRVPPTTVNQEKSQEIPEWVKNTAKWWGEDQISDDDFLNGIQHLMSFGIISVQTSETIEDQMIGNFDLSKAGPFEGDKDAPFTIIMFSDSQCEKCSQWLLHEKESLMKSVIDNGIAKFYIIDYPFLGEDSTTAAEATFCADEQDRFLEYQNQLSIKHNGIQTGWASIESLVKYAGELGLDTEMFEQCLFWDRHALRVEYNRDVAAFHGVVGTPTFFVIGPDDTIKRINGPQPPMIFQAVIDELS